MARKYGGKKSRGGKVTKKRKTKPLTGHKKKAKKGRMRY